MPITGTRHFALETAEPGVALAAADEEWRIIADFPDYAVSSFGQVKRVKVNARGHKVTEWPLKAASSPKKGYLFLTLCASGSKINRRVNRLVCEAFHGEPPSKLHHAAHNDGDVSNNHKDNLRWATAIENEADKLKHGTVTTGDRHWSKTAADKIVRGEHHGLAKLLADDVRRIRVDQRGQRKIAADFGVSQAVICKVKAGKSWRHIV